MTSQEKLNVCKQCLKRKFESKQGIVCSITSAKPAFEDQCDEFAFDEKVKPIYISEEIASQEVEEISNGKAVFYVIAGLVLLIGGIAMTFSSSRYIFYGAIISGAGLIFRGLKVF